MPPQSLHQNLDCIQRNTHPKDCLDVTLGVRERGIEACDTTRYGGLLLHVQDNRGKFCTFLIETSRIPRKPAAIPSV
jgi:hypothetical protein